MNSGWICLWRDLIDKPIWTCSTNEQKVILITLLCMVNHEPNEWEWQGEKYMVQAGQMITSVKNIVKKCKSKEITTQKVRTALERFEKYEFLTIKSTKKNSLITIVNWRKYQDKKVDDNKGNNKQITNSQQTDNKQITTNNNDNKYNNDNKAKHSKAIDYINTIEPKKEPEALEKLLAKVEAKLSEKQEGMPLSSEKTGMPLPVADVPSSAVSVPSLTKSDMPLSEKPRSFGEKLKAKIDYEECVKEYGKAVVDAFVDICLSMVDGEKILLGGAERTASEVAEKLLCLDDKSFGVIIDKLKDAKKHNPRNPRRYYQAIIYATAVSYAMGADFGEAKSRKRGFLNYDSEHGYDHEAIEGMLFDIAVREAEDDEN